MCGIAGIWNMRGDRVDDVTIRAFIDALAHRGPDGRGIWKDDQVGIALAHRRLAILDLSDDGKQPMSYAGGRFWITFNGEIFNFVELRAELESYGFTFCSQTDTEVILAAYEKWGPDMLLRFNGMWALAIFDRQEQVLFFARDRFGIKPFLYCYLEGMFAFASELKAFRHLEGFELRMDREVARHFLENGFSIEGDERTILRNVRKLGAGHFGTIRNGALKITRWWNTLEHLVTPGKTLRDQADDFLKLFEDSIRLRMRSDVPIGTCLSGGFDSTAVLCTMAELDRRGHENRTAKEWQRAFVAAFPGAENDESQQADEVIRFTGVKSYFVQVRDEHALCNIDKVLFDFDDLYISLPTAAWLLYRELRRNSVVVSLDGHGADELMGGYKQLEYFLLQDAPPWLTSPWENVQRLRTYFERLPVGSYPTSRVEMLRRAVLVSLRNHPQLRGLTKVLNTYLQKCHLRKPFPLLAHPRRHEYNDLAEAEFDSRSVPSSWSELNQELFVMFHSTVLPTILRNFDRLSMAHGVEVRMPFMDWRLVCYVMSLPELSKIGEGMNKRIAREAMKGRIPESIRRSQFKIGFNSPMPNWIAGPLRSWARDLVGDQAWRDHDLINMKALLKCLTRHDRIRSWDWAASQQVWSCLHVLWFERNFVRR